MASESSPLTQPHGTRRARPARNLVVTAAVLCLCAAVALIATAWNVNSGTVTAQEKLVVIDAPASLARMGQLRLTPDQALALQRLYLYNTDEADMWIRIAEAIDHDRVNDPALPPVSDAIQEEVAGAQKEQDLEREAMQNYYNGNANDATSWASRGGVFLVEV
mmetsp:Transcript_16509/g.32998  ORF Transcript_16509/g.32998 Transcript_16509/m.32998 type:complete len:163 (+) Transcript_16509:2-490(+)